MKILLAEDDPNISQIAKLTLESLGRHHVTVANDGEMALSLALSEKFDLILLDEMMPKLNGLRVSQEIRQQQGDITPIIFLSARSQAEDIEQFHKFGTGYIAKPFDPLTICNQIEDIIKRKASA